MFTCALAFKRFRGPNPVSAVKARRIPQRKVAFLEAGEISPVLATIGSRWRPIFATAIYAGLRKGEIAGLQWDDVDLARRLLTVARSYDSETTKTGKVRHVPICDELLPHLLTAAAARRNRLVFPMPDGTVMPDNVKLAPILARALKRAGVVLGYKMVCRRKGCSHSETHAENVEGHCPTCNAAPLGDRAPEEDPVPGSAHDVRDASSRADRRHPARPEDARPQLADHHGRDLLGDPGRLRPGRRQHAALQPARGAPGRAQDRGGERHTVGKLP